jgi:hypothetical protein
VPARAGLALVEFAAGAGQTTRNPALSAPTRNPRS